MIVVLDANAAVELVLKLPQAGPIRSAVSEADYVTAPDLYVSEVANALWKYVRADVLTVEHADQAAATTLQFIDHFESSQILQREALAVAHAHGHPVYDTLYAVLARRNSAVLVTKDKRLRELATDLGIEVLTI